MPPEPSFSSTLYLPMVKRRHLPWMRCSAWKLRQEAGFVDEQARRAWTDHRASGRRRAAFARRRRGACRRRRRSCAPAPGIPRRLQGKPSANLSSRDGSADGPRFRGESGAGVATGACGAARVFRAPMYFISRLAKCLEKICAPRRLRRCSGCGNAASGYHHSIPILRRLHAMSRSENRPRRLPARLPRHVQHARHRRGRPGRAPARRSGPSVHRRLPLPKGRRAIWSASTIPDRLKYPMLRTGPKGQGSSAASAGTRRSTSSPTASAPSPARRTARRRSCRTATPARWASCKAPASTGVSSIGSARRCSTAPSAPPRGGRLRHHARHAGGRSIRKPSSIRATSSTGARTPASPTCTCGR